MDDELTEHLLLSDARKSIISNALECASELFEQQGLKFSLVTDEERVPEIRAQFQELLFDKKEYLAAAASLMQISAFFNLPMYADEAKKVSASLYQFADESYYADGRFNDARRLFMLAAGLQHDNRKVLEAMVEACLQQVESEIAEKGEQEESHPLLQMALPYAQLLSQLDSGYSRLDYVQGLIDK